MVRMDIEAILERHAGDLMAIPGVVGTAIGLRDGQPCLKVLTTGNDPLLRARIPLRIEGYSVIVEETGEIRALNPGQGHMPLHEPPQSNGRRDSLDPEHEARHP